MKHGLKLILITIALAIAALRAPCSADGEMPNMRSTKLPANSVWLESLDMASKNSGWGNIRIRRSLDMNPIMLAGGYYPHGIGTQADSDIIIDLKGAAVRFNAMVGIDDETRGKGSVKFRVFVDGRNAAESPALKGGDKPYFISVDLTGAKIMYLQADSAGDGAEGDHADWGGAYITLAGGAKEKPVVTDLPATDEDVDIAHTDFTKLAINGPRIVGSTPGREFIFRIPATGKAPLDFSAKNLPDGLKLDASSGVIRGSLKKDGEYIVELSVTDSSGTVSRKLTIIGGKNKLALTPPMGWNSWNVWGLSVDQKKVQDAIDSFVSSGLASFGFQYVNIDDGWEASERAPNGEIVFNEKFPNVAEMTEYAHSKGLKVGIYSSPGPLTCGKYLGSWEHEEQDAMTWARLGFDYLKYDWCSYGSKAKDGSLHELQKPYKLMTAALDKTGRDIVHSMCQYGMGLVWMWGESVGGNLWRTTGDITDTWNSMASIGFGQAGIERYAGPGHWNDPDMLVVGNVGWGPSVHPTRLTKSEQITHITLWSMLSSPLLIGCDLTALDQFTLDLLTNSETLDVNQDPLGKQARRVWSDGLSEVWIKKLYDGSVAVALFNRYIDRRQVTVNWSDIGVSGSQPVRNLWKKTSLGEYEESYTADVPAHGAVLLKIGTPNTKD